MCVVRGLWLEFFKKGVGLVWWLVCGGGVCGVYLVVGIFVSYDVVFCYVEVRGKWLYFVGVWFFWLGGGVLVGDVCLDVFVYVVCVWFLVI